MHDLAIILYHFFHARKLASRFKTKQELQVWQQKCIKEFIGCTLSKSPFYRDYVDKKLDDIPIINKSIAIHNFNKINTVGITLKDALDVARKAENSRNFKPMIGNVSIGLSSGTSGKQSVFMASRQERLKWAGIILAKALPDSILQPYKIAFFLRANNNLYTTLGKSKRIKFNFFDLTIPFEDNLRELDTYKPDILTAPASVLKLIAHAQNSNKININPSKIFSVAEVLYPEDQNYIEEVFDKKAHQIYQCTEGFLGISNDTGKLCLNEEYLHIEKEWIDKDSGRFIPIITDFTRTTQPIVRYRLDDVLIENMNDQSPFTSLLNVEGRCDDICYFETYKGTLAPVFSEVMRQILAATKSPFDEYKVIQHSPHFIEIELDPFPCSETKQDISTAVEKFCILHRYNMPTISFSNYSLKPLNQKLKRIERNYCLDTELQKGELV